MTTSWDDIVRWERERRTLLTKLQALDKRLRDDMTDWLKTGLKADLGGRGRTSSGRGSSSSERVPGVKVKEAKGPPVKPPSDKTGDTGVRSTQMTGRGVTFVDRVRALFREHPELRASDVLGLLKMKADSKSMDRAKRTLQKLYEAKELSRDEPGLYSGR